MRKTILLIGLVMVLMSISIMASVDLSSQYELLNNMTFETLAIEDFTTLGAYWSITEGGISGNCLNNSQPAAGGGNISYAYIENSTFLVNLENIQYDHYIIRGWYKDRLADTELAYPLAMFHNASTFWYAYGYGGWATDNSVTMSMHYKNNSASMTSVVMQSDASDYTNLWHWVVINMSNTEVEMWLYNTSAEDELFLYNKTIYPTTFPPQRNQGYIGLYSYREALFDNIEIWRELDANSSLVLSSTLSSNQNLTDNPLYINFTGSVWQTSNIFNCSLYINETLNSTQEDIDLSSTQQFTIDTTNWEQGYNFNITCSNNNATDDLLLSNIFVDTVVPTITLSGITNNSIFYRYIESDINLSVAFYDTNLYALNFSVTSLNDDGSDNNVLTYSFYNGTSSIPDKPQQVVNYSLTQSTDEWWDDTSSYPSGRYVIRTISWDSHTSEFIDDYKIEAITKGVEIEDDIKLISDDVKDLTLIKEKDRYNFELTPIADNPVITVQCNDLRYLPNSEYKNHFICWDSKKWIDFEGYDADTSVKILDKNTAEVTILQKLDIKQEPILFKSIGDLNTISKSYYFNITDGFTFYAKDGITNTTISNLTILIYNSSTLIINKTTTGNNITVNITEGSYLTNITALTYVSNHTTITYNTGGNFTWNLYKANSLYLFFYDEDTGNLITGVNVTNLLINLNNQSYQELTDTGSMFVSGFGTGEYEMVYSAPGYLSNSYFVTIATSTTQAIDLYLVPNATGTLIVFSLSDEYGNPIYNATLKRKRFVLEDNAYIVTGMSRTDISGETSMYLVPNDVFYSFVVNKGSATVFTTTPQKIFASLVYFRIPLEESILKSYTTFMQTYTNLSWSNTTKTVSYTWDDSTGLVLTGCLKVLKNRNFEETVLGINCADSSSATVTFNLTPYLANDTTYNAYGYFETNTTGSTYFTDVLVDFYRTNRAWDFSGKPGLFLSYIFIITMFFVGLPINFSIAVVYTTLSMIILQFAGVSFFNMAFILTITIIGLIVAVVNKI